MVPYFFSHVRNILATLVCVTSLMNSRNLQSEACVKNLTKFLYQVEIGHISSSWLVETLSGLAETCPGLLNMF